MAGLAQQSVEALKALGRPGLSVRRGFRELRNSKEPKHSRETR